MSESCIVLIAILHYDDLTLSVKITLNFQVIWSEWKNIWIKIIKIIFIWGQWQKGHGTYKIKGKVTNLWFTYTSFTRTKIIQIRDLYSYLDCYLDHDPEVVPIYTGHSLFNTTKCITLFFIVQTMLNRNLDNTRINYLDSRSRCSVYTGQNLSI